MVIKNRQVSTSQQQEEKEKKKGKTESLYSCPVWTTAGEPPTHPYQSHADRVL